MLAGHDVQEHLDAGEVLACVGCQRKCVGGVLGVIGLHPMHIEAQVLGKVERSFVVESLGDDDGLGHSIDFFHSHDRIECSVSLAVLNDCSLWYAVCHKCVSHAQGLINAIKAILVTADEYALDFTRFVQFLGGIDAVGEKRVSLSADEGLRRCAEQLVESVGGVHLIVIAPGRCVCYVVSCQ